MPQLRAPSENGTILALPAFAEVPDLVAGNHRILNRDDVVIDGLTLRELRTLARDEAIALSRKYLAERGEDSPPLNTLSSTSPLILAGHQPELSHPGVWAKNFALNGLARKVDGVALNLIVDNDTVKSASVRVPVISTSAPQECRLQSVPFDEFNRETPYEDYQIADIRLFESFSERVKPFQSGWGFPSLLPSVWKNDTPQHFGNLGERFVAMRRIQERKWGCHNLELPVSWLSQSRVFVHFARHLFTHAARFRSDYNDALNQYRLANAITSNQHPAPDLARDELPFWVAGEAGTRRMRATTSSNPAQLRPRALSLTLFARVCLGDFFIHGIGGGKYDEVTDTIIARFFGITPPAYQVLSATWQLPFAPFPVTTTDLASSEQTLRDLYWNPQRHLLNLADPQVQQPIAEKRAAIAAEPNRLHHTERRKWFQNLQRITQTLRAHIQQQLDELHTHATRQRDELAANTILKRRDYPWVLFPEEGLKNFLMQFLRL